MMQLAYLITRRLITSELVCIVVSLTTESMHQINPSNKHVILNNFSYEGPYDDLKNSSAENRTATLVCAN